MEFLILGPLEVRNGEHSVRLSAAKQRALLGVLLLNANETVSTSRLVDELWGERPPATAEKLVQGYVHALRKELGNDLLQTQPPGYRLSVEPRALDLLEFERLAEEARAAPTSDSVELRRRALALWRGPPLADVVLEGPERHTLGRLSELRLATQLERIDAELELGRHAQLVAELEALVAEHPYQERAAAQLMLALYRSGRQAEALDVYRTVSGRLDDELGLQPGQELRRLEAAILRHDDALSPPAPAPATTTSAPPPGRRSRRLALGAAIAAVVVIAAVVMAFWLRDDAAQVVVPPNHVAAIDPATNKVTSFLQTGIRPGPVDGGGGSLWVANLDGPSLTRIDPATPEVKDTISLPATPTAIAFGRGAVWVVNRSGTLYRVDPEFRRAKPIKLGPPSIREAGAGVDLGEGSVWAAYGESTLAGVDPNPETREASTTSTAGAAPAGLVVAYGAIWVAFLGDGTVRRFYPSTFDVGDTGHPTIGRGPSGIAAGAGSIWVACTEDDYVARVPADLVSGSHPIPVGDGPTSVAFGAGAVWVANTRAGTVSRIDPETNKVTRTIDVGNAPAGITFYRGRVWVTVQAPTS